MSQCSLIEGDIVNLCGEASVRFIFRLDTLRVNKAMKHSGLFQRNFMVLYSRRMSYTRRCENMKSHIITYTILEVYLNILGLYSAMNILHHKESHSEL
jgi:hypothetical protein